jgi:hypothetical protein
MFDEELDSVFERAFLANFHFGDTLFGLPMSSHPSSSENETLAGSPRHAKPWLQPGK